MQEGTNEGISLGTWLGITEGTVVGSRLNVGSTDGTIEILGLTDGTEDGSIVGKFVNVKVGSREIEGVTVGVDVGSTVGLEVVGSFVGASEGVDVG